MRKFLIFFLLFGLLSLTGCATCDPRFQHCGGDNPQMQDEIADEVGQML
jgi:hypothetical protein